MRGLHICTNLIIIFFTHYFTRASRPSSSNLATFLEACCTVGFVDFVDLYFFCANILNLYPSNFILLICSVQRVVKYCHFYGSVYHCFSTFWALGFTEFAVDSVLNLPFQVKYECHAVAHHILDIQSSGTNNTKSTTELSPVLIRLLLQIPVSGHCNRMLVWISSCIGNGLRTRLNQDE